MFQKQSIDNLCVNTIRMLSADMVEKAKSGHPGLPMGAAAMAYVLWTKFLKHNPKNPYWLNRDRFVLSAGHGSALLYSLLHLTGYNLSLKELKNFRQWGSKTAGHPEYGHTPGVETTTGPLGQGFATGVGMALAERLLANRYNRGFKLFDYYIYGIISDGDLMEGVSGEAASYAGTLKLGKIIYLYDDNNISIEGSTNLTFKENVNTRFKAYGWHTETVKDGNNLKQIEMAILAAQKDKRPSLIICKTHIGFGSPNKVDTAGAHGAPLGEKELKLTKKNFGWPQKVFYLPKKAIKHFRRAIIRGRRREKKWSEIFVNYKEAQPKLAEELINLQIGKLSKSWEKEISRLNFGDATIATRTASGMVINAIAPNLPSLVGGSADLGPSNNTEIKGAASVAGNASFNIEARNIHFGAREHAMGAILNGLALSKIFIPYGATFLIFSNYMRPAIRQAAMMGLRIIYIFTHDSIGLGEDGPTHQPIEQLAALRAMPNLAVIRPADANETAAGWRVAIKNYRGPTCLILTRQKLPIINQKLYNSSANLEKGAYILYSSKSSLKNNNGSGNIHPFSKRKRRAVDKNHDVILIATGSEVHLALVAAKKLEEKKIKLRVVSMPSWDLFEKQPQSYKDKVLPPEIETRVAIEAGSTFGWHKYVGSKGKVIGIDNFGASAPGAVLMEKFGFNVKNVVRRVMDLATKNKNS